MKIRQIMRSDVISVRPDTPAREAYEQMRSRGFRHLPVVNGNQEVTGILSDRDLRDITVFFTKQPSNSGEYMMMDHIQVGNIMVPDPRTVEPDDDVREALLLMYDGKFSSLPVVRDAKLVGIVTLTDMLKLLYELLAKGS